MPVISRNITVVAQDPTPVRERLPGVWRCLEIVYGTNQRVFSLSDQDAKSFMPSGAVYVGALKSVSDYSRNCGYLTGTATISAPSYTLVDKDFEISEFIRDKAVNGRGSLGIEIREYEWPAWSPFPVATLNDILMRAEAKGTFILENHSWAAADNIVLQCKDINRGLDVDIFEPYQWKQTTGITDTSTFIPTDIATNAIADQDVFFTRGQHYDQFPSTRGCFLLLKSGEKVFSTGLENRAGVVGFVIPAGGRGQLNTTAQAITVGDEVEPANYPNINEYVLIKEPVQTMAYALATGELPSGAILPRHWTAGMDKRWIHLYSYALFANPFELEFRNPGKQNCKQWLEKEVLSADQAVHAIDHQGRLTWTPVITPTTDSAGQILLNKDNCKNIINLKLRHDKSQVHTSISIEYNHNTENTVNEFESRVIYDNPASVDFNGINKAKTVSYKGIRDGIHTSSQIRKLAIAVGDDNFYPKQTIDVECLVPDIRLGTLVAVDFDKVRDDMGASGVLKRTMIVIAAKERRKDRVTTYTLMGTQQVAADAFAGQAQHNLPAEEYRRGGTNITQLPGVTLVGNRITGTVTLTMGEKYYYVDDTASGTGLEWGPGLTVNIAGTGQAVQWWCFGPWVNNADFSFEGRSDNQGGAGQTESTPQMLGDPGLIACGAAGGSIRLDRNYSVRSQSVQGNPTDIFTPQDTYKVTTRYSRIAASSLPRVPQFVINSNDGQLGGIPANLGGMGGTGGPLSLGYEPDREPTIANGPVNPQPVTTRANGGTGGTGGGPFICVTWGGANNGTITTSGGRPLIPPSNSVVGQDYYGGEGAGGGPGTWLWIIDGNHAQPVIDGSNFIARLGEPRLQGEFQSNKPSVARNANTWRSGIEPAGATNMWQEAHRIIYTAASENLQTYIPESIFSSLAISRQQDGKIELIVTDGLVPPSNGLPGDMAIPQAQLDNTDNAEPFAWVMNDAYEWDQINWNTVANDYRTLLEVNRRFGGTESIISDTRPVNKPAGTHWLDSSTGTEWILGATAEDDILFRDNGVPLGEELLNDPNFALYGQGRHHWVFTRDADYLPVNVLAQALSDIRDAFITYGQVGGEFGAPSDGSTTGTTQVTPPVSMKAVAISPTEIVVTWVQPTDMTGIASQEVLLDTVVTSNASSPHTYTGLTPEQTYNVRVRNVGTNGNLSTSVSETVTTPPTESAGGQIGIVLTDQGRTVVGTAYQDNASIVIEQGRQITLTLDNGFIVLDNGNPVTVGANGAFSFNVPSSQDGNLNKSASIYTNNGSSANEAQLTFTYQL